MDDLNHACDDIQDCAVCPTPHCPHDECDIEWDPNYLED